MARTRTRTAVRGDQEAARADEGPDPIRAVVGAATHPGGAPEVIKDTAGESATGGPPAGRTTLDDALAQGPKGALQLLGPGLITGASDDDPSGIGTYSQAGSQFGFGTLWLALFTFPLMVAVQEACARIALHTGVGLGTSLRRKFPTWVVGVCIVAVFTANTVNVGADLGAVGAAGGLLSRGHIQPAWLVVPVALLIGFMQLRLAYATIFRVFKLLTLALFAYVITVFVVHPPLLETLKATFVPHVEFNKNFIGIVVAVLGTTISPYLFFWQASSEVEEMKAAGAHTEKERRGVTHKELHAARIDVFIGMLFSQLVMYCIILTSGSVIHASGNTNIQTAQQAADALRPLAGPFAFVLFSAGMIGTGLLAIPVLTGSAAYAVKEFFGFRGSMHEKPSHRPTFYLLIVIAIIGGLLMNFLNIDPIKALVVTAIINGVVAPPILVLIALLARDRSVMGDRRSGPWSNGLVWLATLLMGAAALALVATLFL
ncbi:MAG: Nramp family divalent metal transporter [Candidatus Dormibacteraeota bacterium]|uniref:Iron transporter n=1 Tax=Candidatus Aeolococcus gillhamiae TaxID=3127015 RepID=A0A2W6AZA2_9BACT|nr:Nramp family divalent metal transporter [Candidatus Dormibacteraeota bacterium]PZR83381.1 MAG: iron transporter [Candidatus Dormibacter sp. RRmetagenome_bin12]